MLLQRLCSHVAFFMVQTDSISVIFISDLENSYRGHRDDWCKNIVSYIKNIGSKGFYYSTGMKVTADLVIHGGDLSDTTYGVSTSWQVDTFSVAWN